MDIEAPLPHKEPTGVAEPSLRRLRFSRKFIWLTSVIMAMIAVIVPFIISNSHRFSPAVRFGLIVFGITVFAIISISGVVAMINTESRRVMETLLAGQQTVLERTSLAIAGHEILLVESLEGVREALEENQVEHREILSHLGIKQPVRPAVLLRPRDV